MYWGSEGEGLLQCNRTDFSATDVATGDILSFWMVTSVLVSIAVGFLAKGRVKPSEPIHRQIWREHVQHVWLVLSIPGVVTLTYVTTYIFLSSVYAPPSSNFWSATNVLWLALGIIWGALIIPASEDLRANLQNGSILKASAETMVFIRDLALRLDAAGFSARRKLDCFLSRDMERILERPCDDSYSREKVRHLWPDCSAFDLLPPNGDMAVTVDSIPKNTDEWAERSPLVDSIGENIKFLTCFWHWVDLRRVRPMTGLLYVQYIRNHHDEITTLAAGDMSVDSKRLAVNAQADLAGCSKLLLAAFRQLQKRARDMLAAEPSFLHGNAFSPGQPSEDDERQEMSIDGIQIPRLLYLITVLNLEGKIVGLLTEQIVSYGLCQLFWSHRDVPPLDQRDSRPDQNLTNSRPDQKSEAAATIWRQARRGLLCLWMVLLFAYGFFAMIHGDASYCLTSFAGEVVLSLLWAIPQGACHPWYKDQLTWRSHLGWTTFFLAAALPCCICLIGIVLVGEYPAMISISVSGGIALGWVVVTAFVIRPVVRVKWLDSGWFLRFLATCSLEDSNDMSRRDLEVARLILYNRDKTRRSDSLNSIVELQDLILKPEASGDTSVPSKSRALEYDLVEWELFFNLILVVQVAIRMYVNRPHLTTPDEQFRTWFWDMFAGISEGNAWEVRGLATSQNPVQVTPVEQTPMDRKLWLPFLDRVYEAPSLHWRSIAFLIATLLTSWDSRDGGSRTVNGLRIPETVRRTIGITCEKGACFIGEKFWARRADLVKRAFKRREDRRLVSPDTCCERFQLVYGLCMVAAGIMSTALAIFLPSGVPGCGKNAGKILLTLTLISWSGVFVLLSKIPYMIWGKYS